MSKWAQIDAWIYFKEKVSIEQLQELNPKLIPKKKEKYNESLIEKPYTLKEVFWGSEGGCKVGLIENDRLYISGGLRDVNWKWDEDLIDIFDRHREDWRKILKSWIKLIDYAECEISVGFYGRILFKLTKKHFWYEQTIYEGLEE